MSEENHHTISSFLCLSGGGYKRCKLDKCHVYGQIEIYRNIYPCDVTVDDRF